MSRHVVGRQARASALLPGYAYRAVIEAEELQDIPIDEGTLQEIVHRIVEVAQPERIILFGSAAQGKTERDSDVDLLVVKEGAHRRKLAGEIYMRLIGVGQAVDVVTPEDIERYGDSPPLIIEPALREGKVIYAA